MKTINCKGHLIDLSAPKVMGILNCTPDSFYDGGKFKNKAEFLAQTSTMLDEGATFIDIGGYSSRPGATHISETEELERVLPIIELLVSKHPDILISIDTFRSKVALKAIEAGACMVNDISSGNLDINMFDTIAELHVPYIMMHMPGNPKTMQSKTSYTDIVQELIFYFSKKLKTLRSKGVNDLIIDLGFGFGKTAEQNYQLLNTMALFKNLEAPILTGVSRKSMLYKLLDGTAEDALNATTVANTIALLNGSNILRVHDVKEANEAIQIVQALNAEPS